MWPNLRKEGFHAHISKTHFSPSNDICTHWLTIQVSIDAESCQGCFCCGLLLRLVRCPQVFGSHSMAPHSLDKQIASCNSPQDWLMSLQCFVWYVTYHTKQLNSLSNSSVSRVVNYSLLFACQGDVERYECDLNTRGYLTSLSNKPQQKQPWQLLQQCLPELLVNVYIYCLMVKGMSCSCVCGSWLFSNPFTYIFRKWHA